MRTRSPYIVLFLMMMMMMMMMMRTGVVAQQLLGTIFSMRRLPNKKMEHFRTDFAFFFEKVEVCVCVCVCE